MKESQLQTQIKNRLTKHGWLVVKIITSTMNGIPDLMCIRKGVVMFLEVKTEDGVVAPLQEYVMRVLSSNQVHSRVVRSVNDVDVYCHKTY
jgi:Holliday junction resolvase